MAGLLGHLSSEDKELIEAGVHPVIGSDWRVKETMTKARSPEREKEMGIVNINCHSIPPKSIYVVLQEAEANGVEIPKDVDEWWVYETMKESMDNEKPM